MTLYDMHEIPSHSPPRRVAANGNHVSKSPTRRITSARRMSNHRQSESNGTADLLHNRSVVPDSNSNGNFCVCGREIKPRLVTQSRGEWNKRATVTIINAFLALTLYLILGTVVFTSVELPGEKKQLLEIKRTMEQHAVELTGTLVNSTIEQLCTLQNLSDCHAAINYTAMEQKTFDLMNDVLHSLDVHEFAADPHSDYVNPHWGYTGAFHFCVTTITTIGYGNFVPLSDSGKVLTVLYCILGIPLFFFVCSQFCKLFSFIFYSLRCKFHVDTSIPKKVAYYLFCILSIQTILFIAPVMVLTLQEDLDVLSAIYFLVITLTTVGYGDLNPLDPVTNAKGTGHQVLLNIATWCYMIIGLSLFGNLIRFIQYRIERLAGCCCNRVDTMKFLCLKCLPPCNSRRRTSSSRRNDDNQSPPVIEEDLTTGGGSPDQQPIPLTSNLARSQHSPNSLRSDSENAITSSPEVVGRQGDVLFVETTDLHHNSTLSSPDT
ncbi:potassium channel subfamily K member 1-like isoform X2 [Convolutriloba macropyga]|uniref:potassium channel subfamily K member 1-like isoform X2 n=1 Tax=Convolutriloba macropyga TaxID=536237 RepID=UPI003F525817